MLIPVDFKGSIVRFRSPTSSLILLLLLGLGVSATGCAGGPLGETLQRSLEADAQLEQNPPFETASGPTRNESAAVQPESQPSGVTPTQLGPQPATENTAAAPIPQPNDPEFIGPAPPWNLALTTDPNATADDANEALSTASQGFSDLTQAPAELRSYIEDLAALDLLSLAAVAESDGTTASPADQQLFQPNQTITRREYARWLATVNNAFHRDNSAKKIRLAVPTAQPVFQDVSTSDPDFPEIQGLAEAGMIPSSLSGSSTTVTFRPDAPLNRADLILWKTPLDTRQNLPSATLEAVAQTWGFQDVAKIDPRVLQTVLADFQNGEFANIRRAFGYTTLFQPDKAVTRAEAAAVLWRFGNQTEGMSAKDLLQDSRSQN